MMKQFFLMGYVTVIGEVGIVLEFLGLTPFSMLSFEFL